MVKRTIPCHHFRNRLPTSAGGDVHRLGDVQSGGVMVPKSHLTPKGIAAILRQTTEAGLARA